MLLRASIGADEVTDMMKSMDTRLCADTASNRGNEKDYICEVVSQRIFASIINIPRVSKCKEAMGQRGTKIIRRSSKSPCWQ